MQYAWNYNSMHIAIRTGLGWIDGQKSSVLNLATLAADADVTARHIRISSSATATRWH